jgi:hypothetical protein
MKEKEIIEKIEKSIPKRILIVYLNINLRMIFKS